MADAFCGGFSQLMLSDGVSPWNMYAGALCDNFELKINDSADTDSDGPQEGSEILPLLIIVKIIFDLFSSMENIRGLNLKKKN